MRGEPRRSALLPEVAQLFFRHGDGALSRYRAATMPHKFETRPDHPAVAYLVRLHADIGGRIKDNKAEAERLGEPAPGARSSRRSPARHPRRPAD